jgi:hypothetical protein
MRFWKPVLYDTVELAILSTFKTVKRRVRGLGSHSQTTIFKMQITVEIHLISEN